MKTRWVIVGAGAIGGTIGGLLCHSNCDVMLVARGEHGRVIRDQGLNVRFPNRNVHCFPDCIESVSEIDWRNNDICVLATKLNDAESLMDELHVQCGNDLATICCFNGLQGERWAAQRFESVVSTMIWMPSTHLFPGDVRVYGKDCPGVLDVGPIQGDRAIAICENFSRHLNAAGFDSLVRTEIQRWRYAKWITNLGNTAQALIVDDWKSVARAARNEGESILDAAGIDRVETKALLERCKHIRLEAIDGQVRPGGSTWQSFQRGKALESEWIEGAMAELASSIGREAPVCRKLTSLASERRTLSATRFFDSIDV